MQINLEDYNSMLAYLACEVSNAAYLKACSRLCLMEEPICSSLKQDTIF
jgi:hypothetical protein